MTSKYKPKETSKQKAGSDKKIIKTSTSSDLSNSSSNPKTEFKKNINFKAANPLTKQKESIKITVTNNTKISQIVQQLNYHFKVNNIVGFIVNKSTYNKTNDILFAQTSLNDAPTGNDIEITEVICIPPAISYPYDYEPKTQSFLLIYLGNTIKAQINLCDAPSKVSEAITRLDRKILNKNKYIVYFPGGNMMNSSFIDFMKMNGKCEKLLYIILNKSKFDPKEANEIVDISKKSINALFQDINNDYVEMVCCILKYINMKLYKSLHTIKALYETINFIPFLTSLYHIYSGHVTKIHLFTIVSFLQFYAPETNNVYKLFNTMSSFICQKKSDEFNNSIDDRFLFFKHDFSGQIKKTYNHFGNNVQYNIWDTSVPIFRAIHTKCLRDRQYWSMFSYKTGLILLEIDQNSSKKPNTPEIINYYDPNLSSGFSKMKYSEIESDEKKTTGANDYPKTKYSNAHGLKCSQGTVSIIDYSGSMIACIDEKGERRSKIAVEVINKIIKTGNDLSINDPFVLLDRQCMEETSFPLEYDPADFLRPSLLYDRIERTIDFMCKDEFTSRLTPNARKRILIVTDGQDTKSVTTKYNVLKCLLEKRIILDVIFLKEGKSTKDLCAISHLSGGKYFRPMNQDDAIFISSYKELIDLTKRRQILNIKSYKIIKDEDFDKMSENMRVKNMINSIRIKYQPDYYDDADLYSPFSSIDQIKEFKIKRIQKEIDICASYQLYAKQNRKEPFFMIFRKFVSGTNELDHYKAIVFLKGNNKPQDRVIHQVLIQFPDCYPFQMPMISMLSKAKIDWPYGEFKLNEPYTLKTRLLHILYELNKQLKITEKPTDKDNNFDPINSLDQIRCVFHIYEGEQREIKYYDKYFKFT